MNPSLIPVPHYAGGLPPSLMTLSDIILTRGSRRSMSLQYGTETSSTQSNSAVSIPPQTPTTSQGISTLLAFFISYSVQLSSGDGSLSVTQTGLNLVSKPVSLETQHPTLPSLTAAVTDNESSSSSLGSKVMADIAASGDVSPATKAFLLATISDSLSSLPSSCKATNDMEQDQKMQEYSSAVKERCSLNRAAGVSAGLKLAQYTLEDVLEPPTVSMETDQQSEEVKPLIPTESDASVVMTTVPGSSCQSHSHSVSGGMESRPKTTDKPLEEAKCSKSVPYDFLKTLFTNWPCIVTTVLGYYPVGQSMDGAAIRQPVDRPVGQLDQSQMSSVQSLDSFTSHLILNCKESCIEHFTSTIVGKINSCLSESGQHSVDLIDTNLHDIDSKLIDEKILPILVGKRFLNSVIRVLGMEHSRIKNTFLEMQQLRSRAGGNVTGGGGGGGEGGGRGRVGGERRERAALSADCPSKNVVKIIKLVLYNFLHVQPKLIRDAIL